MDSTFKKVVPGLNTILSIGMHEATSESKAQPFELLHSFLQVGSLLPYMTRLHYVARNHESCQLKLPINKGKFEHLNSVH